MKRVRSLWTVLLGLAALTMLVVVPAVTAAEEGRATWYGPGFHGRVMANGQIFDMYDPTTTAANAWPLGTWIRVTSVRTGRSVVVQVRDRGAFKHEFDLSYGAYVVIDDPRNQYISVRYEVLSGAPTPTPRPTATPTATPTPRPTATPVPERPQLASRSGRPAAAATHQVQPGENLWAIAERYGLTVAELAALNELADADVIVVGQMLRLSPAQAVQAPAPEPARSAATGATLHVVQVGETLGAIADRYGVSADAVARLNDLADPNRLVVGQSLRLPARGGSAAASSTVRAPVNRAEYTVQAGDVLGLIAERFSTTVATLMRLNELRDPDGIAVGQSLKLPAGASATLPANRATYIVKVGDTLSGIADAVGVSMGALMAANRIADPDSLYEGQELTIPDIASATAGRVAPRRPATYTVQPGDSLSSIADAFGTTSERLATLNDLDDPDHLQVGQVLRLPPG
ncbi:MAG: LysM peptidoglycan-binding domain-containing protein [Chloroflexi bacterium]|nr:LysM peptidoglycan-binding domain-containing protein [Chloroflexota bacterium]